MFCDDYVIIFLLATITTTAKNTHTHSLTYNYNTLFMYYSPLIFQSIAYKYSATSIGIGWHSREACEEATILHSSSSHHMSRMYKRAIFRLKSSLSPSLSSLYCGKDKFKR